jgi:membrane fusion protein, multidrug efflux system
MTGTPGTRMGGHVQALRSLELFRSRNYYRLPGAARPGARSQMLVGAVMTGAVLVLIGCGGTGRQQARPQPVVPVTVAKVVLRTMPNELKAIGHVEPIATVAVRARIGGELLKVAFQEGQSVRAGDVLFTIDPRQYEAALRQAEAQLARDSALLKKAEADITRYAGLVKQDFVTKEQYDQITANAEALRAGVASDEANIDNAKLQVAYCTITSPVSGRTGSLMVKVGNLVKANDQPLVTVNQTKPIYVTFTVPAQYLPAITTPKEGTIKVAASLPENGDGPFDGTLTFVDNTVDAATSTILLKATFVNQKEALWPGQFVTVMMTLGEEPNRVVAPASAVQTGQQGPYVFVVKGDDTVELRQVKVKRLDETDAVIDEGLSAGETVVTDGQLRLVPGSKVQIKEGLSGNPEKTS